jgi:SHS2 domain-containing protein
VSAWIFPTTADAGMRVYAPDFPTLLIDAALGVQSYLMAPTAAKLHQQLPRHTGEWRVRSLHSPHEHAMLFLAWLDEVLYKNEVHQQWLTDAHVRVEATPEGLEAVAQVSWIMANDLEREIEIKALTTHEMRVAELQTGETLSGGHEDVPDFVGPGWYANIVFDI